MKSDKVIPHVSHDQVMTQIISLQSMFTTKTSWRVSCVSLRYTALVKICIERIVHVDEKQHVDYLWNATITTADLAILKLRVYAYEPFQSVTFKEAYLSNEVERTLKTMFE